jgi:hypothetical protein
LPVYRKKNDPDTWVEAVKGVSGYRWYLKPAANKGPNSSICFAYVAIDEENLALPLDITTPWTINTANGFADQKSIVVFKASDKPTPFLLEELVSSAQLAVNEHIALAKAEVRISSWRAILGTTYPRWCRLCIIFNGLYCFCFSESENPMLVRLPSPKQPAKVKLGSMEHLNQLMRCSLASLSIRRKVMILRLLRRAEVPILRVNFDGT